MNISVLYDQNNNLAANSTVSQNFGDFPTFDAATADDFVVPAGPNSWSVTEVSVPGVYFNGTGPATDTDVVIYADAAGLPGAAVCTNNNVVPTSGLATGSFVIDLPAPCLLAPGTYWVSVVANMNFGGGLGEWGWTDRTVTSNNPAAFENPGGGFAVCPTWGQRGPTCNIDNGNNDQGFTISGDIVVPVTWTVVANMPSDFYGGAGASDGTYFYVAGGYSFSAGGNVTTFYRYDPVTNTWVSLAAFPDTDSSMASAVYGGNGKIYVFGGEDVGSATVVSTTRIYDIATDSWSTGTPMPDIRAFMASGYYNGNIYLVGGYSTGSITPAYLQTWAYNVATDTWNTALPDVPAPGAVGFGGAGSGVVNGHLYVAGGRDANNTVINSLYDFDIAASTWSQKANLPIAMNVPGNASIYGQLWIYGGGNPFAIGDLSAVPHAGQHAPATAPDTQIYDPGTDTWSTGPNLNVARSFISGANVGPTMAVAAGGYDGANTSVVAETAGTFTPPPNVCNRVLNGDFETGDLFGWPIRDSNPSPVNSTDQAHGGTHSAHVGSPIAGPETPGDSSIFQEITVPPSGGMLSFWTWTHTVDSISFDWQDAYVTDTNGNILATIFHECNNDQAWVNVTYDMTPYAGTVVRVEFLGHSDNAGDPTGMYVDDVHLDVTCPDGLGLAVGQTVGFAPNNYTQEANNLVRYTFLRSQPAPNQFALFDTHDPWGFTVVKDAITGNGYTYSEFPVTSLPGFNFSDYQVVILNFDDTLVSDFITDYTAAFSALQTYLNNGGVVWIQTANQGSPGDSYTILDGATCNGADFETDNYIIDPAHPIMTAISSITGNSASHVNFTGIDPTALLITSVGTAPGGAITAYEFRSTACITSNLFNNPGFETGDLTSWPIRDSNPSPVASTDQAHTGTFSAHVGSPLGGGETPGDSSIYQQINVPATGGMLSFWYWTHTVDSITFDWQDAYVTDTAGNILTTIFHQCTNNQAWVNQTFDMTPYAGQSVRVEFLAHGDNAGDPTGMYVDDVDLEGCQTCNLAPPTITPSGPTTFCQGGSVTLDAGAGYAAYLWSDGETTESIVVSASGSYSVTVTDGAGCQATSTPTVVTVNPLPTPSITPSGPTTFCAGGSVTLDAGAGYSAYLWSDGETTETIVVSASGSYSVTVTDGNGCQATSAPVAVAVNPLPTPSITPSGATTFCAGGSVTLDAGAGYAAYLWSPGGETTQTIVVSASGSYSVTVMDGNGCQGTSAPVAVTVVSPPTPVITVTHCLTPNTSGQTASVPANAGDTYNWTITGGTIDSGQGTDTISFTSGGPATLMTLSVDETDTTGCTGNAGDSMQVNFNDVPASNPFYNFICTIARHAITAGCGSGNFCPANNVLRSQMAVFILRGEHGSVYVPPPAVGIFGDVPASNPFAPWIEELYNEQITGGCSTNPLLYCPNNSVSRAGMAVFLLVAEHGTGYVPPACAGLFTDVACPSPFADWIEELYNEGITGGCNTNPLMYCPNNSVTRAQMSVFLTVTFALP